jgi:hypothetical protein
MISALASTTPPSEDERARLRVPLEVRFPVAVLFAPLLAVRLAAAFVPRVVFSFADAPAVV